MFCVFLYLVLVQFSGRHFNFNMASADYMSDVGLQQNIQEIEIESIPAEKQEIIHSKPKKWEQKQVQIRTLEGEFSVTMWATGTDDGKF